VVIEEHENKWVVVDKNDKIVIITSNKKIAAKVALSWRKQND
jgi:hypothetical protein